MLGHQLLQQIVGPETQRHVARIGTDQNRFVLDDQIDRVLPFARLLLAAQRPEALLQSLASQQVDVGHSLRGVDAGQRHDRVPVGEYGGDAGLELPVGVSRHRMFANDVGQHETTKPLAASHED